MLERRRYTGTAGGFTLFNSHPSAAENDEHGTAETEFKTEPVFATNPEKIFL